MGRTAKEVVYENNRLKGKLLTSETCQRLESLIALNEQKGFISDLKHIIYDLSPSEVQLVKESKSNQFVDLSNRGTLTDVQTLGVAYMYFAERLVLGDSVGMGKTVEVCGLCNKLESEYAKQGYEFRFLFLTNKTIVPEIRDKMIKFTGNYVDVVWGEKPSVQKFCAENYDECHYSVVAPHSLINSLEFQDYMRRFQSDYGCNPFDILIIDESGDILKNTGTKVWKNGMFLQKQFERVILLNATPFEKSLNMFYNQISFIDDTFLPTKTAFTEEYEITRWVGRYSVPSGKYKNQEKFRNLVAYRYFARTRKSTGAKMIDCSADIRVVPLSPQQKYLLTKTSIPGMVYDCPSYFNMGVETDEETTPKLKALVELINVELINEPSILVYTKYKEAMYAMQRVLYENCIEAYVMNGDSSAKEREALCNSFKLGDFRVLITNVQKGLDFGNCNVCIFYTYDTNSNNMVQFEGRMTREYNIVNKHSYILVSRGNELRTLKNIVADRARASDLFAGSDFSCVLSILLDEDKIRSLK